MKNLPELFSLTIGQTGAGRFQGMIQHAFHNFENHSGFFTGICSSIQNRPGNIMERTAQNVLPDGVRLHSGKVFLDQGLNTFGDIIYFFQYLRLLRIALCNTCIRQRAVCHLSDNSHDSADFLCRAQAFSAKNCGNFRQQLDAGKLRGCCRMVRRKPALFRSFTDFMKDFPDLFRLPRGQTACGIIDYAGNDLFSGYNDFPGLSGFIRPGFLENLNNVLNRRPHRLHHALP